MDPISAGIAGAASLVGGFISNDKTDERLQKQMDFQREMRDTAYQATMADMQKAGLNPILAYQRGPTSSPTGAFASASDVITPAVNSAMAAGRTHQEVENMQLQQRVMRSQEELNEASARRQLADADVSDVEAVNRKLNTAVILREATKGKIDEELYQKYPWLRTLGTFGSEAGRFLGGTIGAVSPAVNAANSVARTFQERWP